MTRINTVDVRLLSPKHLAGEKKEITRVFTHVRKAQEKGLTPEQLNGPKHYVLGTGHVKFFYDKLEWVWNRYLALAGEMTRRGYNPTILPKESLMEGIDNHWWNDYTPTYEDKLVNMFRLVRRDTESHYTWSLCDITDKILRAGIYSRLGDEDRQFLRQPGGFDDGFK